MKSLRLPAIVVLTGAVVSALIIDGVERTFDEIAIPVHSSVPSITGERSTWFCTGGSAPGGRADVSLEIVNAGKEAAVATVSGIRSGTGVEPGQTGVRIEPGDRESVRLVDLVSDSAWMGAVVEVGSGDVVVEQTFVGATGIDRAPCHTRTASRWVVASGATRRASHGEEMLLLLLNPFPDDAVVDIYFEADVGIQSVGAIVVPARRVVALDVTEEVTVASRVSAVIDVVAGRLAASRIQLFAGDEVIGLNVTPATADASAVWYLPTLDRASRDDVVSVTNPSPTETAEVDLEIVADGDVRLDPIELTVRPGRTVQVRLADESRLSGLGAFSIIARSLSGLPIAVMHESTGSGEAGEIVTTAATVGADVAGTRWLAPLGREASAVVILNPSTSAIATVELAIIDTDGRRVIADIEIGPRRRTAITAAEVGGARPIVEVVSAAPVVVSRDLVGQFDHRMLPGILTSAAVSDSDVG